jgi:hypothetical protein
VLPTLFALGVFTFVRLVQSSTEDLLYGRAINRLRGYYQQLVGEDARYLLLGGHDDIYGVLWNMGMRRPSRWQLWFTLGAMVAVLDAIIAGTTLALVVGPLAKGGLVWAIVAGAATALCSLYALARVQSRMHLSARGAEPALFPPGRASGYSVEDEPEGGFRWSAFGPAGTLAGQRGLAGGCRGADRSAEQELCRPRRADT